MLETRCDCCFFWPLPQLDYNLFFAKNARGLPTDPEPVPDNNNGDGDMHGDKGHHDDDEMPDKGNAMMGNLTYLQVALFSTLHAGAELFLWHEDDEYTAGDVLGTNTWKLLSELLTSHHEPAQR